jgi:hypothetical protein
VSFPRAVFENIVKVAALELFSYYPISDRSQNEVERIELGVHFRYFEHFNS